MSNILPNIELARKRKEKSKIIHNFFNLEPKYKIIGLNKYFYVRTYGCQSNIRDSENIKGILSNMGYKEATNANDANIVILNTCAIRENAEEKVFGEVGFLKSLSKKKDFMFGICGCMAQEESVIKKIINKIHHVSFVFGTHNIYDLPCIIYEYSKTRKQIIKVYSKEGDIIENLPSVRTSNVKAFVNIMYGCDKFCSYCIVPYTRGKLRSRNKEDILKEINDLINKDYKEITLLGQNVNSYGLDKKDGYLFKDLLVDVCKTNIPRVRFATSNP
jgi:tRNA-2-methylthio-N6-dimethylallyladenosine synthase